MYNKYFCISISSKKNVIRNCLIFKPCFEQQPPVVMTVEVETIKEGNTGCVLAALGPCFHQFSLGVIGLTGLRLVTPLIIPFDRH
jgi:hypothetical protein